jgi:acyl-CoA thioester hydrolase
MFQSVSKVRVRYSETDQMGVVYHGNYASYFEIGRTDALRALGLTYRQFEDDNLMMPVLEMNCRFIKPAYYDELLTIKTTMHSLPTVRLKFDYEIFNEREELITTGSVTLVSMNKTTRKPCNSPPELVNSLIPYFK